MAKKKGIKTPEWILEGYSSKEEYEKAKGISKKKKNGKTFDVMKCPKCKSYNVEVVLGDEGGLWRCNDCGWKGKDIEKVEMSEEEFINHMYKIEGGHDEE